MIYQEKETITRTQPLGYAVIYAGDSFQRYHGCEPSDQGLQLESFSMPNGSSVKGVRVP